MIEASILKHLPRMALDLLLPPRCLSCKTIVATPGALCPACWDGLRLLAPPHCARCGLPFATDTGAAILCGSCLDGSAQFGRARAALRYDASSRSMILGFKHGDRTALAVPFARWMARAGRELLADADMLVPVPLHPWRLFRRRYNQAALLTKALSRLTGVAHRPDALARIRATPPQGTMGRFGRRRNVAGAFRLTAAVEGRHVLLVDDVLTTGVTVDECARVLKAGGARQVDVLTLARVVLS